jgi:hypothetical protein
MSDQSSEQTERDFGVFVAQYEYVGELRDEALQLNSRNSKFDDRRPHRGAPAAVPIAVG